MPNLAGAMLEPREANRLAQEVLSLDRSITSVGIISNNGMSLGGAIANLHRHDSSEDPKIWEIRAFKAAMIMGNVKAFDRFSSDVESVLVIRKQSKTLLIWVPQYAVILTVVLEKSTGATSLSDKIRKMFKIE